MRINIKDIVRRQYKIFIRQGNFSSARMLFELLKRKNISVDIRKINNSIEDAMNFMDRLIKKYHNEIKTDFNDDHESLMIIYLI